MFVHMYGLFSVTFTPALFKSLISHSGYSCHNCNFYLKKKNRKNRVRLLIPSMSLNSIPNILVSMIQKNEK